MKRSKAEMGNDHIIITTNIKANKERLQKNETRNPLNAS